MALPPASVLTSGSAKPSSRGEQEEEANGSGAAYSDGASAVARAGMVVLEEDEDDGDLGRPSKAHARV